MGSYVISPGRRGSFESWLMWRTQNRDLSPSVFEQPLRVHAAHFFSYQFLPSSASLIERMPREEESVRDRGDRGSGRPENSKRKEEEIGAREKGCRSPVSG